MSAAMELLPCPFCGEPAEIDHSQEFRGIVSGRVESSVAIYCTRCTVQMQHCYSDHRGVDCEDLAADLMTAWNGRANLAAQAGELDELRVAWNLSRNAQLRYKARAERLEAALRELLDEVGGISIHVDEDDEVGHCPSCHVLSYETHSDACVVVRARAALAGDKP